MTATSPSIPVLDLGQARGEDGSFDRGFIDRLRDAAHRVGFFQLTGFGAAEGQTEGVLGIAARFFALPLEDRLALDNRTSPHFRGYTRMGHEITAGRPDAREQLDVAADRAPVSGLPGG